MSEPQKELINRVANSGIEVFNLEDHYPAQPIVEIDLKDFLFKELILKEKDFRAQLKEMDWSPYAGKIVVIYISNDAIIPVWAYMLLSAQLADQGIVSFAGTTQEYLQAHYKVLISELDAEVYAEKRVVIKGCSHKPVPPSAYAALTAKLQPFAQSIMYGEPCSTVPIFKRPRKLSK